MKIKYLLIAIIVPAVLLLLFYFKQPPEFKKPVSGTNIVAFGDSLVAGVGASADKDFVSLLKQNLNISIINAGISGDTSSSALARLDSDVLGRDPRVVIVLIGGNDLLTRLPKQTFYQNLSAIVDRIQSSGAGVLLVGIKGGLFTDEYGEVYEQVAHEKQAAFVPDILSGISGNDRYLSDAIHPNDQGYGLMAERIEPLLRRLVED